MQAELLELRADTSAAGEAVVVESTLQQGFGPVTDVLVRWGTLQVGDWVVAGTEVRCPR